MGVTLCRCFTDSCTNGCMPEGFALIKMTAPPGCPPTTLYDTCTGKSYPWNATFKADIGDDGCWKSCELPYSDNMHPKITYEIVDVIAGACSDDCGCDLQADCGCYGDTNSLPKCTLTLLSTAGYIEGTCVDVGPLCAGEDYVPPCENLKTLSVDFTDHCLGDDDAAGLGTWFAPGDGILKVRYVSLPAGITPATEAIMFNLVRTDTGGIIFTGTLAAGQIRTRIDTDVNVADGIGVALQVIKPTFNNPPPSLNLQNEFTYCDDPDPACKNVQASLVTFSDYCLTDDDAGGLGTWFAPHDGELTIQWASLPSGVATSPQPLTFDIINVSNNVILYTGVLPAGQMNVRSEQRIQVPEGIGIALRVCMPNFAGAPQVLNIQAEYTYCPKDEVC